MKTYTKTVTETKPRLVIENEAMSQNPREWSNLGYFITVDKDYHSPDKHEEFESIIKNCGEIAKNQSNHIALIENAINRTGEKVLAIFPIVKYEHSGVSYKLGTAHGFDYSNNGFYIVTEKSVKELGTARKDFEKVIKQELEAYNKYINGDLCEYSFILYDTNGEEIDSSGGYEDIEAIRENLPKEWAKEDLTNYLVN
jgi:hypothetical protein